MTRSVVRVRRGDARGLWAATPPLLLLCAARAAEPTAAPASRGRAARLVRLRGLSGVTQTDPRPQLRGQDPPSGPSQVAQTLRVLTR